MGERGLITYRTIPTQVEDVRAFFVVDSFAGKVLDPVGSGDALLAYATLAMLGTGNAVVASVLGSMAAAVECEHDGNIPVTPDDVRRKLEIAEKRANFD
jgi:sugar/nucleoside kinase (ribokinase family)